MDSDITFEYWVTLALWVAVPGIFFSRSYKTRYPTVGLLLCYCMQLALIHLTGALIQLLPWYTSISRKNTIIGFPLTGYALAGLLVGYLLAQPGVIRRARPSVRGTTPVLRSPELGWICMAVGFVGYFGLTRSAYIFASMSAVVANGLNLAAVGFCQEWWFYYQSGQKRVAWQIFGSAFMLPVLTVVLAGFLGFGINALFILCAFIAVSGVPRRTILVGGAILAFGLLSTYVVYMSVRGQIREVVWGKQAIDQRAAVVSSNLQENWAWFSVSNFAQLDQIDDRLNQNFLVGAAVRELEGGRVKFAEGETLQNVLLSLVPRLIWADKPMFAGSGTLVTRFTGIDFDASTSVGIGHVMELYVNYGRTGILVGFIVIGILLSTLEIAAAEYLHLGRLEGFLLCFVAGSTFLTVGGNLAESPPAFIGSMALTLLVTRVLAPSVQSKLAPRSQIHSPRERT